MNSETQCRTLPIPAAPIRDWRLFPFRLVGLVLVFFMLSGNSSAYSVLTHEEIIDLVWTSQLRPLLLLRYPGLSPDELKEAHAYAYGGAVIQDLGFYPFGSTEFSDLVHYVRSGDFVRELLLESQDANEYAFALGALAHYASDIAGHPAVNQSVAMEYLNCARSSAPSVRCAQPDLNRAFENRVRIRRWCRSRRIAMHASSPTILSDSKSRSHCWSGLFPWYMGWN